MGSNLGRPTKYNDEVFIKAEKYLNDAIDIPNEMPTIEGLALKLGINDETVTEWAKKHEDFSATVKDIKLLQRQRLQTMGLFNRVNSTMAIFLLKCNHGYVETSRQELTGRDGDPIEQNMSVTYMPEPLPDDYYSK